MTDINMTILHQADTAQLQFEYGDITETEPRDNMWFRFEPSPELVEWMARFVQRMIWRRDGEGDDPDLDAAEITEEARKTAEWFASKVCRKTEAAVQGHFVAMLDAYLEDLQGAIEIRLGKAIEFKDPTHLPHRARH
jgi:hypothetical protein